MDHAVGVEPRALLEHPGGRVGGPDRAGRTRGGDRRRAGEGVGRPADGHGIAGDEELLERADHDYKGHRARAVHEITAAIHAVEGRPHHARRLPHIPKPHAHRPARTEPQAVSDAQLRQAIQQLAAVEAQLGTLHPKARAAIAAAVRELHTALRIR
jgi:hypothetical protein